MPGKLSVKQQSGLAFRCVQFRLVVTSDMSRVATPVINNRHRHQKVAQCVEHVLLWRPLKCLVLYACVTLDLLLCSLPEHIVVPVSLADQDLKQYSTFFIANRIPVSINSCADCKISFSYRYVNLMF